MRYFTTLEGFTIYVAGRLLSRPTVKNVQKGSLTKGYKYIRSLRIQEKENKGEIHESEKKC